MLYPLGSPLFTAWNSNGAPLSGGKLYCFEAGTSTAKATYADASGNSANPHPVALNARGEAPVFFAGVSKFVLKDASDVEIWSADYVGGNGQAEVSSMDGLRALGVPAGLSTVNLVGYAAAGDGGGGQFYWDAASTATDNGGTVILPTGYTGAGRWRRINGETVNVATFGADGSSDATAAIDRLLAAFPNGCTIVFPSGTYPYNGTAIPAQYTLRFEQGAWLKATNASGLSVYARVIARGGRWIKAGSTGVFPHHGQHHLGNLSVVGPWVDVTAFGAKGSEQQTFCAMTAGSAVATLAAAQDFEDGDYVAINGAGPSGATLNARIVSGGGTTSVTLSVAASTSVSGGTADYDAGFFRHDDAPHIQAAIDFAGRAFDYAYPHIGNFPSCIVAFPPRSYRIVSEMTVYPGITLKGFGGTTNTTDHTRLINDREWDRHIFKFTRYQNGSKRDTASVNRVEDIALWYVTGGVSTFAAPLSGTGIPVNADGSPISAGRSLYFPEPTQDLRISRCNFSHSPGAIGGFNVGYDADHDSRILAMFVEDCEFDAGSVLTWFTSCKLDIEFKGCQFYGGYVFADNCVGTLLFEQPRFQSGGRLKVQKSSLDWLGIRHPTFEQVTGGNMIDVDLARRVEIVGGLYALTDSSTIRCRNAEGGVINSATIIDSGYNTPAGTFHGAIKLEGCTDILVSGNSITTPDAATYNEFGILTIDSVARDATPARTSAGNLITGNVVNGAYNGATYNGQDRRINVAAGDFKKNNVNQRIYVA